MRTAKPSSRASPATRVPIVLSIVLGSAGPTACDRSRGDEPLVVLANRDDDDLDGLPDADDERVNGPADLRDLASVPATLPRGATALRLDCGDAPLRFFVRMGEEWRHVGRGGGEVPAAAADAAGRLEILVEASRWAGLPASWSGSCGVRIEGVPAGSGPGGDEIAVRVAPVRLLAATAPVDEAYVATGRYDNAAFLAGLRDLLEPLRVPLRVHATGDWREMWMQDTMEVGIATAGGSRMSVVLAGLRGADTFPPTLLGPDVAVAEVAAPRPLGGGDDWFDWYGNLEASPPVPGHPLGRVIHGRNRLSGLGFHPDVIAFLEAQRSQSPIWIDTSWLLIRHVDEIVSFLPGADGRGAVVVPDPVGGLELLGEAGDAAVAARRREANARIAREIEAMLDGGAMPPRAGVSGDAVAAGPEREAGASEGISRGLLDLVGLGPDRVVRLPVPFDVPAAGLLADGGVTGASSLWSNPVNSVLVDGTVICGSSGMPPAARDACRRAFLDAGATRVEFIDDGVYQKNHGNVHCATNARRRDADPPPARAPADRR